MRGRAQYSCAEEDGSDDEATKVQVRHNARVSTLWYEGGYYLSLESDAMPEFHIAPQGVRYFEERKSRGWRAFMHGDENGSAPCFTLEGNSEQ